MDSSNIQICKLLEDSGSEVDAISGTASRGALVLDGGSGSLSVVVDFDGLSASRAGVGVRAATKSVD